MPSTSKRSSHNRLKSTYPSYILKAFGGVENLSRVPVEKTSGFTSNAEVFLKPEHMRGRPIVRGVTRDGRSFVSFHVVMNFSERALVSVTENLTDDLRDVVKRADKGNVVTFYQRDVKTPKDFDVSMRGAMYIPSLDVFKLLLDEASGNKKFGRLISYLQRLLNNESCGHLHCLTREEGPPGISLAAPATVSADETSEEDFDEVRNPTSNNNAACCFPFWRCLRGASATRQHVNDRDVDSVPFIPK